MRVCVCACIRDIIQIMGSTSILKSPWGVLGQASKQVGQQAGRQASKQVSS